jgi:hypothetical protein
VQQTVNNTVTTITNYLWDEQSAYGNVILETDASNNIQASYFLSPDYAAQDGSLGVVNGAILG